MDTTAYLERIDYRGPLGVNAETLRGLQVAHLLTVPFENLSIHSEEPIVLDEAALFDKVVRRRRGGFCYELNGLFAGLLREIGFDVVKLSARVAEEGGGYSPDFDHMVLMVSLEQRWLVDVGFGDTFRYPLSLDDAGEQEQIGRAYRLRSEADWLTLAERKGDAWKPQYRFTLRPYEFADFEPMCHFHQTSQESHFRRGRVCTLATPTGRLTLSELRLIESTFDGGREQRVLGDEREREQVLAEQLGLVM